MSEGVLNNPDRGKRAYEDYNKTIGQGRSDWAVLVWDKLTKEERDGWNAVHDDYQAANSQLQRAVSEMNAKLAHARQGRQKMSEMLTAKHDEQGGVREIIVQKPARRRVWLSLEFTRFARAFLGFDPRAPEHIDGEVYSVRVASRGA